MQVQNKTIIITDPCYIINKNKTEKNPYQFPWVAGLAEKLGKKAYSELVNNYRNWENEHDDWKKCAYGENMEALGITNYLTNSTIYGDWSCTTYEETTHKKLGNFCADAGLVSVFILDEVLQYNPDFEQWIKNHPWCVTTIENFSGTVDIEVIHISGVYTADDEYEYNGEIRCKAGETWEDDEVRVIGKGSINFFTTQTGL